MQRRLGIGIAAARRQQERRRDREARMPVEHTNTTKETSGHSLLEHG
jgi:hypothetical protein